MYGPKSGMSFWFCSPLFHPGSQGLAVALLTRNLLAFPIPLRFIPTSCGVGRLRSEILGCSEASGVVGFLVSGFDFGLHGYHVLVGLKAAKRQSPFGVGRLMRKTGKAVA